MSGAVAAVEGHWRRGARLDVGFATHGGMWGDAVLLSAVNALVVPWIEPGWWLVAAALSGIVGTMALHRWWHGGHRDGLREHMWPARPVGRWRHDLSWAGRCHVVYVACEIAVLACYVVTAMPAAVVLMVSALLTVHVPLGVLQPPWIANGQVHRSDVWQAGLAITAIWLAALVKTMF